MADKKVFNPLTPPFDEVRDDLADLATRSHTDLTNIGTNSHATIDSHLASTSNPHGVTAAQAGAIADAINTVNDTHIDWGTGADQVSLDDVPDGSFYERVAASELSSGIYKDATTAVKGIASFASADFTVNSGAVSIKDKFVLNTGDQIDGDLTIDNTSVTALVVRKNAAGGDAFVVDTINSKVKIPDRIEQSTAASHHAWTSITLTTVSGAGTNLWTVGTDPQCSAFIVNNAGYTYYLDLDKVGASEGDNFIIYVRTNASATSSTHFIIRNGSGGTTLKDIVGNGTIRTWGCWFFMVGTNWYAFWTVLND